MRFRHLRLVMRALPGFVFVAVAALASAQEADRRGRLLIKVVDQTEAVLPNARVTLTSQRVEQRVSPVPQGAQIASMSTSRVGIAVFEGLAPARYTLQVEFPGFQTAVVRDVRVRAGDNRRTITLQLEKRDEAVTVERDRQSAAVDPRGSAFSTVLTREQIEALPDDPEAMEEVLKAMSPPGSVIRVDGFTGGRLPPKSQIRSIRLPRLDVFAAQNHGGMSGAMFIDIMTAPGAGPLRGTVDFSFLDDALNARNAMTSRKGDERLLQYGLSLSGTIRPNKTSFSIYANAADQYFSSNLFAVLPGGVTRAEALRQPQNRLNFSGRIDHSLTRDRAMRLSFDRNSNEMENLGVGQYNLPERGYTSETTTSMLRFSENGPLGRRFFWESRAQLRWSETELRSGLEAPTVRVNDAFTSGGAQVRGGRDDLTFEVASDLDYVRGSNSWRTGVLFEGGRYGSDDTSNYLGTYTFASLADYEAGKPSAYTRRVGDPTVAFRYLQASAYVQDDYRILRSLLLSAGVRYGYQTHVGDSWNVSPRVSVAWSPRRNGTVTVRGNYGYFYDWVSADTYKQTLLVDGFRQREINIRNPAYPEAEPVGATPPTNRYLWSDSLVLPMAHRVSVGVDQALTKDMRLMASYHASWGRNLLRARNLNSPVDGRRPDPRFANIVQLVSDAASRMQAVSVGWNLSMLNWRRTFIFANYSFGFNETNTAGAFSLPASGDDLDGEWGPAAMDSRHRFSASFNMQPVTNLTVAVNTSWRSAAPYNLTTGRDDNGDGVFNDRPAGVGRNSERGSGQFDLGGRLSYAIGFGPPRNAGGGGGPTTVVMVRGGGSDGLTTAFGGGAQDRRFRLEFYVTAQNLVNVTNYLGYSGVMASPLFGLPVAAASPRRVQTGVRFGF